MKQPHSRSQDVDGIARTSTKRDYIIIKNQITTKLRILVASMEESKKNMQKVYKNGYKQFKRGKNITIGNCGAFFTVYMSNQQFVFKI